MEAKDKQCIQEEIVRAYPGTDPDIDIDWEMIEIAFTAGMKEVVDWLKKNAASSVEYQGKLRLMQVDEWAWQAFLKEQGIA